MCPAGIDANGVTMIIMALILGDVIGWVLVARRLKLVADQQLGLAELLVTDHGLEQDRRL